MNMLSDHQLDAAFRLLLTVVGDLRGNGRHSYAAAVKSAMRRESNQGFNEQSLGFATFRAFLDEARSRGLVTLVSTPSGDDLEVLPGSVSATSRRVVPTGAVKRRIRSDVWKAFVDWQEGWTRVWDTQSGRALMFPATPNDHREQPGHAELRAQVTADPLRFRIIDPITFDLQIAWMKAFAAAEADALLRVELEAALTQEKPAMAFTNAARYRAGALSRWNKFRLDRVIDVVRAWCDRQGVDFDALVETAPAAKGPRQQLAPDRAEDVRRRVLAAVTEMSLAELLRLPIPVEYIIRD